MKASKFSDAQKAFILKHAADGMPVADICRKAGISHATYFNCKHKYDGLLPTEMRRPMASKTAFEDSSGTLPTSNTGRPLVSDILASSRFFLLSGDQHV